MKARRPFARLLPYALLLVAPAAVLAGIGWKSLDTEDRARREDARHRAQAEVDRLVAEEVAALERIRVREGQRAYFEYQPKYMPQDAVGLSGTAFVDSPLTKPSDDPRVLGWFQWTLSLGVVAGPDLFPSPDVPWKQTLIDGFSESLLASLRQAPTDASVASADVVRVPVQTVAANEEAGKLIEEVQAANSSNSSTNYLDNYRARNQQALAPSASPAPDEAVDVRITPIYYLARKPRAATAAFDLVAWRLVWIPGKAGAAHRGAPRDRWLLQGYALDAGRAFPGAVVDLGDVRVARGSVVLAPSDAAKFDPNSILMRSLFGSVAGLAAPPTPDAHSLTSGWWPRLHAFGWADDAALDAEARDARLRYLAIVAGLACVVGVGFFVLGKSVRREMALAERKQDFVAAVTHELKTPLTGIRMYADMLKEGWVPEGQTVAEYAERIAGETTRLSALVDQVLDMAALDRGVANVHAVPGDLGAAVRSATALVATTAQEAGVPVAVDVADDLPAVSFDPAIVRSLVVNLVDNAVKYSAKSPTKDVRVSVRRSTGGVEVAVADRGAGIAKADQARLFEPFSRGGREETRTARGVGLGLALVRRYAEAHRATVTLDSEEGRGTTVSVRFPV